MLENKKSLNVNQKKEIESKKEVTEKVNVAGKKSMINHFQKNDNIDLSSSQDDKAKDITSARLSRVLYNNRNYEMTVEEIEDFVNSKIDFGKYKKGAIQNYVLKNQLTEDNGFILQKIKSLSTFDKSYTLDQIYDFSGDVIKIKEDWLQFGKKMKAQEIIKSIFSNNNEFNLYLNENPVIKDFFITNDSGFSFKEILIKDPDYINKIVDFYDFSNPESNKQLFKYFTNQSNISKYINGEELDNSIGKQKVNTLSSFEYDVIDVNWNNFVKKFKKDGFIFIDTETTGVHHILSSMLSFGYVKVEYDEENDFFKMTDKGEIFIQDIKEPITEFSVHGGDFSTYTGNHITQDIINKKGLNPIEASEKIKNIITGKNIFAHNANFDMSMLNTFFNDIKVDIPLSKNFYDTLTDIFPSMFKKIDNLKGITRLGLSPLIKTFLNLDVSDKDERHTALQDSIWSVEVLFKILEQLKSQSGQENIVKISSEDELEYDYNPNDIKLY